MTDWVTGMQFDFHTIVYVTTRLGPTLQNDFEKIFFFNMLIGILLNKLPKGKCNKICIRQKSKSRLTIELIKILKMFHSYNIISSLKPWQFKG